jgi:pilus assembly protein CpaF
MNFFERALEIQSEIQNIPVENLGYENLENKTRSSVRISQLIQEKSKNFSLVEQKRTLDEFEGQGPISTLLEDETISEILINSQNEIWFERAGKLYQHNDQFISSLTYKNFIERLSLAAGIQPSVETPFCDGRFLDFRLHLVTNEITKASTALSLRRLKKDPWTFSQLQELQWAPENAMVHLKDWIQKKKSFLVVGETGSGKTSVLSACLHDINKNERALLLEDTEELQCPNSVSLRLLTRSIAQENLSQFNLGDLVKQSLRMRPDRLIVGEVRGPEAKDLLMALSTGHAGSMGTLHASSGHQALMRLEMLVQLGAPQWSLQTIRRLIGLSLQGIVVVGKSSQGKRVLKGLFEITGAEETGILLESIYQSQD